MTTGIAEWATRTPAAEALLDETGSFTFAELDDVTARLAGAIVDGRCDDDDVVPVLVGPDRWSVVAILACLRAGVPCAPLATDTPAQLLADLVTRLGSPRRAVVTSDHVGRLPRGVESVDARSARGAPVDPRAVDPETPATVVFTSGSTGRPKGVVYGRSLWDALLAEAEAHHVRDATGAPGRATVCLPFHWVGGLRSLVLPALGASLAVVRAGGDLTDLLGRVDRTAPLHVSFPPALLRGLATRARPRTMLTTVRSVSLGGMALSAEDVAAFRPLVPQGTVLRTLYGASETGGVIVVSLSIGAEDRYPPGVLPLGRARDPDRIRLDPLDDDGLRELIVRGVVALGYLDDPERTAACFGADADGTRWWRSGDIVRADADGLLHGAGRIDDVVKVNGQLAAPAEPERVLATTPGVVEVAVVAQVGARGPRLVAHVVTSDAPTGPALDAPGLRTCCTDRLPAHLVPSFFVRHDALPRLPGGKVDRLALVEAPATPWRNVRRRVPVDGLEAAVVALCREILATDDVQPDDDLWFMGLDSLAAVELAEACSELGYGPFDPTTTLDHFTPATIADVLRQGEGVRQPSPVVVVNADGELPPVFAIPGAGATSLAFLWLARELGADQPVVVVEAQGLRTEGRPHRTIPAMARHVARTIVASAPTGEIVVVGHSAGGVVAYETARQLRADGREVRAVLVDPYLERTPGAPGTPPAGAHRGLVAAARRALAGSVRRARIHGRVRFPGRPSGAPERYHAFTHIGVRAVRRYRPAPADFPVVLLAVEGSGAPDQWRVHLPELEWVDVAGNHASVLHTPRVDAVARFVRAGRGRDPGVS